MEALEERKGGEEKCLERGKEVREREGRTRVIEIAG